MYDPDYERPVESRYLDPLELLWLATARRLGLTVRRDPEIFSRTDGSGMLWLGPRSDLDADDCLAQMLLHEICHWVTNGAASFHEQDWGFPVGDELDPREHACLRLQAWLADRHGLRRVLGPTGVHRQYYDRIPADPLEPLRDARYPPEWERSVVDLARDAIERVQGPPWQPALGQALAATRAIATEVAPFLSDYATELDDDALPSLWSRQD